VRKDGYTKIFIKPLGGRTKTADNQRRRLGTSDRSDIETNTVASTKNESRKTSTNIDEESEEDQEYVDIEDDIEEEFKEGGQ